MKSDLIELLSTTTANKCDYRLKMTSCGEEDSWALALRSLPSRDNVFDSYSKEQQQQRANHQIPRSIRKLQQSRKVVRSCQSSSSLTTIKMSELIDDTNPLILEHPQSDYDRLHDQCRNAMIELETLRRRHAEILSLCEEARQEAVFHKKQHQRAVNTIEELSTDQKSLQSKVEQVVNDRNKLRQDYEEIVLLREQEKLETTKLKQLSLEHKEHPLSASTDTPDTLDDLQQENEDLKDNFDDLQADHDLLSSKYKAQQEDNQKLKEHNEVIMLKHDSLVDERNALKQRCAAAIRGYEKALRDRDEGVQELKLAEQQCLHAQRELEQANKVKIQMSKDIIKLREERNSAMQEYKLVMSERDTVHQEIEKLQDDLGQTKDKAKKLSEDKEKVYLEKEGLRLEIVAVLADRDEALKEVHDLRSRLQVALKEKETSAKQLEEQRQDFEMLKQERNAAKKERGEAIVHRDKILKECFEVKRLFANMEEEEECDETDGLKSQFDKLSQELTKSWKIAEVAMTRRDWAFSERDKVLRELDSMKEKYSKLEQEKALVDEQLSVLNSEHDESQHQFKELRKSLVASSNIKHNLLSSQDSAIDSDPPPYHIENIELERAFDSLFDHLLVPVSLPKILQRQFAMAIFRRLDQFMICKDDEFGFRIAGGSDTPVAPHDTSIFIIEVSPTSIAANKLKVNDCIIRVNDIDMTNIDSSAAYEAIFGALYLNITILRHTKLVFDQIGFKTPLQRIIIKSNEEKSIGLSIDSGLHIKRIDPGSAAAEEETLSIGDKILSVNGQSIENMTYEEAKLLLKRSSLSLTVLKPSVSITSSQPSLPRNTDDEKVELISPKEKIFDDLPKLFNTSDTDDVVVSSSLLSPVSVNHTRNNSAPLHLTTQQTDLILTQNNRSISAIGQMSDEELKKISADLYDEVQRRQEDETKRKTLVDYTNNIISEPEPKPTRNASFIVAMKSDPVVQTPLAYPTDVVPFKRPISAHSSKQSVSSGSTGRYSYDVNRIAPSSPRSFCPTDPLCLDSKSSSGGHIPGIGCINANIISGSRSANSSLAHRRKHFPASRSLKSNPHVSIAEKAAHRLSNIPRHSSSDDGAMMIRTQQKQSLTLQEHLQNIGPPTAGVFDNRLYGTFPGKPSRVTSDVITDRYAASHSSMNTSKPSSHRSFGSHGSFNSSEFSEKGNSILGHIEPVHEETSVHEETVVVENFNEFSTAPKGGGGTGGNGGVPTSARSSGRSLGAISPRSSGRSSRQRSSTSPNYSRSRKSPKVQRNRSPCGEEPARKTVITKGQYPLGITIAQGSSNGIFVTGVNEESIASKVGLKYGDQLLEYNGINLRMASYEQAALILKQSAVENTVIVLAQYNPHKMQENIASSTPIPDQEDCVEEPRLIRIEREPPSTPLGITAIGGNSVGVFISDIQKNSLVELQGGLKCGDQILQYNAKDMRGSTLEEATLELNKPTEVADFHVQFNPPGYKKAQCEIGDSFYVRAMFDRTHPPKGELAFRKGDILHVSETLYNKSQLGVWRASLVSESPENEEKEKKLGKIPSKVKAEQELLLRRTSGYGDEKLKSRKSLFRRSKKGSSHHGINHSRESSDSKADFEIASTISSGTSFALTQIADDLTAYQYVKRYDTTFARPVAIVGAMAEPICDKLVVESASKFARCLPEFCEGTKELIDVNINDGTYIDYKLSPKGNKFLCITPQAIRDVIYKKSKHCLLDINPEAIDKLGPLNLHPIIIYVKYKSSKQIKDLKDNRYIREKITNKSSKDLFEIFSKVEKDYKNYFTATLTGSSLNNICSEIVECVKEQQRKALWISVDE